MDLLGFPTVPVGLPSWEGAEASLGLELGAAAAAGAVLGTEEMRSMSVFPDESWPEAMVTEAVPPRGARAQRRQTAVSLVYWRNIDIGGVVHTATGDQMVGSD